MPAACSGNTPGWGSGGSSCCRATLSDYDFVYELRGAEAPPTDGHAGLLETSRLLLIAPDKVGPSRPNVRGNRSPFVPTPPSPSDWPESVQGDTVPANAELGARIQAHVVDRLEETVRALLPPR
ncbi:MAG: creatininase family protein [Thermoplasmata archaeon]|nr:creatininase family protein [Thermoplasmata archaeon]